MKKTYVKPEIMFESFTLSVNIAGDCDHDTALHAQGACGIDFGGDIIFLTGISGCWEQYDVDDGTSGICYHVPTDTTKLFNS